MYTKSQRIVQSAKIIYIYIDMQAGRNFLPKLLVADN